MIISNQPMRILTLTLLACCTLLADDATKDAKIQQLLKLLRAESIQDQIYVQLGQQIDRATLGLAQQAGLPVAEQRPATADLQAKMTAAMKDNLNWEKLQPGVVQIYKENLSETELDTILAFYQSSAGQAYLAKAPVMAAKSREIAEGKVKELGGMFQVMAQEWTAQHPKPPVPGAK